MTDTDLDRKLSLYLEAEEHDRTDKRDRERRMEAAIERIANSQVVTAQNLALLGVEFREQMKGVTARVSKLEEANEDTGMTNLDGLRNKVKEERDSKSRLYGYIIAGMGAAGLLLAGASGTVIWYLITTHPLGH